MTCDECERCREAGYRFCDKCGQPLDPCPRCEEAKALGFKYCDMCGRPTTAPEPPRHGIDLSNIVRYVAPVLALLISMEFIIMLTGIGKTWTWCGDNEMSILVLIPTLEVAGHLSGIGLQLFWIVLVLSASASILLVFWQSVVPVLKESEKAKKVAAFGRTPLFWLAMIFCADLLISMVIGMIQIDDTSIPSDLPDGTSPESFLAYVDAAVWEEVITRMVYIGLPMMVLALISKRRDFPKYILGGFGMSKAAIVLIVLSAVIFGFAHMSGWGAWKVLPTFISGLFLGYLYVRFGIHVSITMHFAMDAMSFLMDGLLAVPLSMIVIILIIAGVPCLIEIIRRAWINRDALKNAPNIMPEDQESIFFKRN